MKLVVDTILQINVQTFAKSSSTPLSLIQKTDLGWLGTVTTYKKELCINTKLITNLGKEQNHMDKSHFSPPKNNIFIDFCIFIRSILFFYYIFAKNDLTPIYILNINNLTT